MARININPVSSWLLLACLLTGLTGPVSAEKDSAIYKWTDDGGVVQYSQTPPPDRPSERMRRAPPPPEDPGAVQGKLQERVKAMEERQAAQEDAADKSKKEEEIKKIVKKNCDTARKNLANLQLGGPRAYRTADGQVKRLTEEERQARIEEANKQIEEFCNPDK